MSKRYPGNFITGNPVALSQTSNNGVWDLKDEYTATNNKNWQTSGGYYQITKSLRFRSYANAYLSRTQATNGNQKSWTFSAWVKLADPINNYGFYVCGGAGTGVGVDVERINMAGNAAGVYWQRASIQTSTTYQGGTTATYRDPAAWYHVVYVWDSGNSNQALRWRVYVNGILQPKQYGDTAISLGQTSLINTTSPLKIGRQDDQTSAYSECTCTEINFIDGSSLDASYFGYTDPITNIWQPKQYAGSYGTNGFYLNFSENLSLTNLGRNFAGSNYLTYSQVGNNSSYTYNNASVAINNATAPDGTSTGNLLTVDGSTSTHRFYKQFSVQPSGTVMCMSAYVKYSGTTKVVALENYTGSAGGQCFFDVSIGQPKYTATWPAGSGFQYVGNGWYRIWTTCNNSASNGSGIPSIALYACDDSGNLSWAGNSTSGFYFWGVQANLGTTPDPYIATTSSYAYNDFTLNNFSLSAGVTYDSLVDSPTNVITPVTDIGGVVSGNYCTWNPLIGAGLRAGSVGTSSSIVSNTDGNLSTSFSLNGGYAMCEYSMGTIPLPNAGKWYWESTNLSNATLGIFKGQTLPLSGSGGGQEAFVGYSASGSFVLGTNSAGTSTGTALSASTSDIIGVAVDMDNKNIAFYKNNTLMGGYNGFSDTNTGYSPQTGGSWTTDCNLWIPIRGNDTSGAGGTSTTNFGQRPFTYTPPTGYKSLNTTNIQMLGSNVLNIAAIQPHKYFDVSLYGGQGTTQQVKNSGKFQPDLVWVKARSVSNYDHILVDSVRGPGNILSSDLTSGESSGNGYWITGLDSDGFTLGSYGANGTNANGTQYVGWQWKQSPQSGLNIVSYTGNGTTRTISHNLGVVPSMIWIKGRDTQATGGPGKWNANDWMIQHVGMGWGYQMGLNSTATSEAEGALAAPTSSVFTVPSYGQTNYTGNRFVAYVWAEVPGFSKFGTYMGNALVDGDFVYTGFRPKFIMLKLINAVNSWEIWDSVRSVVPNGNIAIGGSGTNLALFAEDTEPESQRDGAQFFSNGFKLNATGSRSNYPQGNTYIYMAFAESPFYLNNRAK